MTPTEVAGLLKPYIRDQHIATVMTAIAGQESSFDPNKASDILGHSWNCGGPESFGLWQINIYWNRWTLQHLGAGTTPCQQAAWLKNPHNNALAAVKVLYGYNGLQNWTSYRTGAYIRWLPIAQKAVQEAYSGTNLGQLALAGGAAALAIRLL